MGPAGRSPYGLDVSKVFHSHGVNLRLLGFVRRHVPRGRLELRERLLCEMMVRASKKEARAEMRAMGSAWGQYTVEANHSIDLTNSSLYPI